MCSSTYLYDNMNADLNIFFIDDDRWEVCRSIILNYNITHNYYCEMIAIHNSISYSIVREKNSENIVAEHRAPLRASGLRGIAPICRSLLHCLFVLDSDVDYIGAEKYWIVSDYNF